MISFFSASSFCKILMFHEEDRRFYFELSYHLLLSQDFRIVNYFFDLKTKAHTSHDFLKQKIAP